MDEEDKPANFNRNSEEVSNVNYSVDTFTGIGLVNKSDTNSLVSASRSQISRRLSDELDILHIESEVLVKRSEQGGGGGCCHRMGVYMGLRASTESRTVPLMRVEPSHWCSNQMKNTRYNVFTFLPLCLFNYFKVFFNLYFLGMTIS